MRHSAMNIQDTKRIEVNGCVRNQRAGVELVIKGIAGCGRRKLNKMGLERSTSKGVFGATRQCELGGEKMGRVCR